MSERVFFFCLPCLTKSLPEQIQFYSLIPVFFQLKFKEFFLWPVCDVWRKVCWKKVAMFNFRRRRGISQLGQFHQHLVKNIWDFSDCNVLSIFNVEHQNLVSHHYPFLDLLIHEFIINLSWLQFVLLHQNQIKCVNSRYYFHGAQI